MKLKRLKSMLSILMAFLMVFSNSLINIYAIDSYSNTNIDKLPDYTELYGQNKKKSKESKSLKTTGILNNIAVFIEFSDQESITINDTTTRAKAEEVFNTGGQNDSTYGKIPLVSLNQYLKAMSYGKLDVKTSIYPRKNDDDTTIISYVANKPRTYFMKKSTLAPDGYTTTSEQFKREQELLENALKYVKSQIEKDFEPSELDTNNDGYIDAISFFAEGKYGQSQGIGFQDLLWPHKAEGYFQTTIAGKNISSYNLISTGDPKQIAGIFSERRTAYGVIVHEFLHILGLPDLYRYSQIGNPVGQWSMMASNGSQALNPLTAFYQNEYLNWGSKLETIGSGTHKVTLSAPKYTDPNEKRAIKIKSPLNKDEYFVVEFRKKDGFDKYVNMDYGGIIVYRINDKFSASNGNKTEDYMYVFRPEETGLGDGNGDLSKATFSLESGRVSIGKETSSSNKFDNNTLHYSDGTNSRIVISNISSGSNDTITFDVKVPSLKGSGTSTDPYIISEPSDLDLVKGQNESYFKMANDIDMKNVDNFEGLDRFNGNFDGQGYKIKNLTIKKNDSSNTAALFNIIDLDANVKNLVLENINIVNSSGRAASLGGTIFGTVDNIKINSGKVEGSKSNTYGIEASGGLAAYTTDTAKISNSYSKVDVIGSGYVGGFIGINSNSKIENTYSTGSVSKKESSDKLGGFIGVNLLTGGIKYNQPKNSYFDMTSSKQVDGIGYVDIWGQGSIGSTGKEGVIGVKIDENILLNVPNTSSKKINLTTTSDETLNGSWKSQNQSIATVSNGVVTAKSNGTTKIVYSLPVGINTMEFTTNVTVNGYSNPIENKKPVINASDITIKVGDKFNALSGVSASDNEDGNITSKIVVKENTVDTTKPGIYKVVYTVIDNDKNIVTKEIKVTVKAIPLNNFTTFTVDSLNKSNKYVTGKGLKDATVTAYVDGKQIGSSKVKSNGTYSITIKPVSAGKIITVKISKSGFKTESKSVKVLNVFSTFTVNSIKKSDTTITGKGLKDATVKAYVGGKEVGSGKVASNGTYSIRLKSKIDNGKQVILKISYSGYATKEISTKVLNVFSTFTVNSIKKSDTTITGKGLKGATVKAYVGGKEVGSGKVASNGTYSIKLKSKISNGKEVTVKMSYSGYATKETKTKVLNVFSTFTVNKVSYKSSYVTGKGYKGSSIKIYNGKTLVGKGTVSSKGDIKIKLTKKQKKKAKLTVKMSKSGFANVEKIITVK